MQDQDIQELRERAEKKKWDSKTAEIFEKEMRKTRKTTPLNRPTSLYNIPIWTRC